MSWFLYKINISPDLYSVTPRAKFDFAVELRNVTTASGKQRLRLTRNERTTITEHMLTVQF
jgi:hypothetical protein